MGGLEWVRGYQAARKQAAEIAANACLVPPDGGSPSEAESTVCDEAAKRIREMQPIAEDMRAMAQEILNVRPYYLLTNNEIKFQIALTESFRAFGDRDDWVNEKIAGLRAEQEARCG